MWDVLTDIGAGITEFFSELIECIGAAITALTTFTTLLEEFDARIVAMTENCGSTEFEGMPINMAIATFRYCVGDIIFYLFYCIIVFGCLFTIYKIVVVIYQFLKDYLGNLTSDMSSSGGLVSKITSIFK